MPSISLIDLFIILAYLAMMAGVGVWSARKVKSMEDYSLAGRSLGYPVMIGTLVGAAIGAASTFGKAGKAYEVGVFLFAATMGYSIGLALFGFFSSRLRRSGVWTIPDAIRLRYGRGMETVMGGVMLIAVVAVFGGQIVGMGAIFTAAGSSFGLSSRTAIIAAGAVIIFYTLLGGLFAVAYTDLIQAVIMLVGVGVILPIAVLSQPEVAGHFAATFAPPKDLLGGMSPLYAVSIFLIDIPFCLVDPGLWQRANAARDEHVIKRSMFVTAGVYIFWSLVCVLLGAAGAKVIPDVAARYGTTDAIIPALAIKCLPRAVVGIVLAGLMAVMMSTASVVLLITGTTLANDLIKPLRPQTTEKQLLLAARLTVIVVGVIGVGVALMIKGIFDVLLLAFAIYISGVFFPTMAALYWDKATRAGAMVSSVAATAVVIALYALDKPGGIEPIMVSLAVSFILMLGVSLVTYNPEKATPKIF